ncbi:uncharacterized protein PV07_08632 [Cladophialophora immunda]|uniref:Uncharacterized protein n=1 Tax=Cladophialophora immunda TaxID=569365 RepID=A0A0D2C4T9_9EURO|nr:uncharacterized protein PV07_08632 [Cladophialophora immunda]KIW25465.1 hypothetical protein PV07_08632 [Cladophialophora immunda]
MKPEDTPESSSISHLATARREIPNTITSKHKPRPTAYLEQRGWRLKMVVANFNYFQAKHVCSKASPAHQKSPQTGVSSLPRLFSPGCQNPVATHPQQKRKRRIIQCQAATSVVFLTGSYSLLLGRLAPLAPCPCPCPAPGISCLCLTSSLAL